MTDDSEGWSAIPNWLLRDPAVDRNVKMVYLVLSGRVGRNRVCWPSQVTIANEAGDGTCTGCTSTRSTAGGWDHHDPMGGITMIPEEEPG
jgi:hypothetical protein